MIELSTTSQLTQRKTPFKAKVDGRYAWYSLGVLFLVYMFNQMDRYSLSILSEDIKKSLSLNDSQLGFLSGTAFAMFYALFGYPMARLADRWSRVYLLAIGLSLWSISTAMTGLATSLGQMTVFRIGVGMGEATAAPVGFSLISDLFSKAKRATALGVFSSALNLGAGLSIVLGGLIASQWNRLHPLSKPFGLQGWSVAFIAFGIPGLMLALWLFTVQEPVRGQSDDQERPAETRIWVRFFYDLCGVLPPLTLYDAARRGWRALAGNILAALIAAGAVLALVEATGDLLQWAAIGFGYYAAFSASRSLRHSDRATFALTWATPTFVMAMIGFGAASMVSHVSAFWYAPLAVRSLGMPRGSIGGILGGISAVGGMVGIIAGGQLSDILLKRTPLGRIWVSIGSNMIPLPFIACMCLTHNSMIFFLCYVPVSIIQPAWVACGAATIQDLVLPRMRGTATNIYFLVATMVGTGLGPYVVGKISVATHSLSTGILSTLTVAFVTAVVFLWLCGRGVVRAEATKVERAATAGEVK